MGTISVGQAYLFQAQEDLRAAKMVGSEIASAPSSFYMLLQMVFEKLAKAYMYRNTNQLPKRFGNETADKHFSKIIDAMIRSNPSKRKYYKYLIGLIKELEVAQPSIAKTISENTPRLEYPWEDKKHSLCYPARDLPLVKRFYADENQARTAWAALKFAQEYIRELTVLPPTH